MTGVQTCALPIYCIIMIPSSMDFMQYFIGIHIELEAKESISKPLIVKRCELSSFVANDGTPTKVGTKYSEPIYPFAEII